MADMVPCDKCGHYHIICEDEKSELRADIERLRKALEDILYAHAANALYGFNHFENARAALAETEKS